MFVFEASGAHGSIGGWASYYKLEIMDSIHGLSPRANYTDRATAASRRNDCRLLRIILQAGNHGFDS
jgi:hypothetical protein